MLLNHCLNGKNCMMMTMEMPVAAGEGSVNLAAKAMSIQVRNKVCFVIRSEGMKDSSSGRVFLGISGFPQGFA